MADNPFALIGSACCAVLITLGLGSQARAAQEEFSFETAQARRLVQQVRAAHGLITPAPIALVGTRVSGDMTDRVVIVIDRRGKYRRSGEPTDSGGVPVQGRRTTHLLDSNTYRQIPPASPELAAVARPRVEHEFTLMSVTTLLRPRRGQRMTVRVQPPTLFQGEQMRRLVVSAPGQESCTLFIRGDSTVAGWSTLAETSVGMMPRTVVVEASKVFNGMRVPVRLREQTGDSYISVYSFPRVLTGDAALREFTRSE